MCIKAGTHSSRFFVCFCNERKDRVIYLFLFFLSLATINLGDKLTLVMKTSLNVFKYTDLKITNFK